MAVLKAGETRSIQTLFEFPDAPHTFKLVEGNGPVHIIGQVIPGNFEVDSQAAMIFGGDEEIEEEEDDEDDDNGEQDDNAKENCKNTNNKKKRKN